MGTGGWNADSPQLKDYLKRHVAENGAEPDRWANPVTYASLQMLQQAIERVGKIDRAAVIKDLQTGTFDTIGRQGEAGGQPLHRRVPDRAMAERRVLWHRAGTTRRRARADLPQARMEAVS